jgi:hypothetical protein
MHMPHVGKVVGAKRCRRDEVRREATSRRTSCVARNGLTGMTGASIGKEMPVDIDCAAVLAVARDAGDIEVEDGARTTSLRIASSMSSDYVEPRLQSPLTCLASAREHGMIGEIPWERPTERPVSKHKRTIGVPYTHGPRVFKSGGEGWFPAPFPLPPSKTKQFSTELRWALKPSICAVCRQKLGMAAPLQPVNCSPNRPTFSEAGE